VTDNTGELQHIIDTAEDVVIIPNGTWMIDATKGLMLRSGLQLQIQGVLQAIPNGQSWTNVLRGDGVQDVKINLVGQIVGDRQAHLVTTGEWGMGVCLLNCTNVTITGAGVVTQCWGDGIYIQECVSVSITGINSLDNRRNNMSVISVDGLIVSQAAFNGASGTAPSAGIDLEPDNTSEFVKNVDIGNCQFVGNDGAGILLGFGGAPESNFGNIKIHNNTYKNNKPISGVDPWYAKLLYATCRTLPGYDWWGYPRDLTL
jgi:hypothetical protein